MVMIMFHTLPLNQRENSRNIQQLLNIPAEKIEVRYNIYQANSMIIQYGVYNKVSIRYV